MSSSGQSGTEVFAGYLDKKTRSVFSGWQRRYFVLLKEYGCSSATLRYWDTDKSYRDRPNDARGEISMRVSPGEALARRVESTQPTMHMKLPGRTWEFRSKDDDQITQWLKAFRDLTEGSSRIRAAAKAHRSDVPKKDEECDVFFERPIGTKTPSLLPRSPTYYKDAGGSYNDSGSDPIRQRDLGEGTFTVAEEKRNGDAMRSTQHRPKTPPGGPSSPSMEIAQATPQAELQAPATPRNTPPVPASFQSPATPPPPPPRQVGVSTATPRGQPPATPRGQSSGADFATRAGGAASYVAQNDLLTPRSRAPPVPMLSIDFQHMREPKSAQQIQTVDGTIYFRAATRVSPRNYKSFTARKFLQPDISSDESEDDGDQATEEGEADSTGEDDQDGALLTDDDLLDLFMKKQKRMAGGGGANDSDRIKGGNDDVLASLATPRRPAVASQQSDKAASNAEQLSSQARALLSPRLPQPTWAKPKWERTALKQSRVDGEKDILQGRQDIYPHRTSPIRPVTKQALAPSS